MRIVFLGLCIAFLFLSKTSLANESFQPDDTSHNIALQLSKGLENSIHIEPWLIVIALAGIFIFLVVLWIIFVKRLESRERQFRTLLESSPDRLVILNVQGNIVMVNRQVEVVFGYRQDECIGKPVELLLPDSDREKHRAYLANYLSAMTSKTQKETGGEVLELVAVKKTGEHFYTDVKLSPIETEQGLLVACSVRDVTDHKRAEETLEKLHKAVEQSPATVVITDKDGVIEYVNPEFTRVTGYSYEEAIGKNPRILKSGKMPEALYEELWSTILTGNIWKGEMVNKIKNGDLIWENISIAPIIGENGSITNFVAVKEDITEKRQALDELKHRKALLRSIIDNVPNIVMLKDCNGRHLVVNKYHLEATGCDSSQVLGKTDADFFDAQTAARIMSQDHEIIKSGLPITFEESVPHPDGSSHDYLTSKVPLANENGEVYALVCTATDITEQKTLEKAIFDQREQLQTILNLSPIGVFVSVDDHIRFANPRIRDMFDMQEG